jgi:hypothetical protein
MLHQLMMHCFSRYGILTIFLLLFLEIVAKQATKDNLMFLQYYMPCVFDSKIHNLPMQLLVIVDSLEILIFCDLLTERMIVL